MFPLVLLIGASYTFEARPIAALARNLDCLAGVTRCQTDAYKDHWKRDLQWSSADDALLDAWAKADEAEERVDWIFPPPDVEVRFPLPHTEPDLEKKVRIAALQATSIDDYRSRLELLLPPKAAEARIAVLEKLLPRYEKFFNAAKPDLDRYQKLMTELIAKKKLDELIGRIAKFYGAEIAGTMHFLMVPRPVAKSRKTNAEQLDNYSIVEVPAAETPEERVDVVLHELFHYFYASVPPEKHAKIIQALSAHGSATAFNAYSLLDESLATALGNGLVAERVLDEAVYKKRLEKKQTFYNDDAIDTAAKALLPDLLEHGLTEKFVTRTFLEAADKTEIGTLKAGLRNIAIAYGTGAPRALRTKLMQLASTSSLQSFSPLTDPQTGWDFHRHLDQNGIVLLIGKDIEKLPAFEPWLGKDLLARLKKLSSDQNVWAYGVARSPKAKTYYLYAKDAATLEAFLPTFIGQKTPFDGPLFP